VEDDGLASVSAFHFVQDMLERYKHESRIAYVGAVNYGPKYGNYSYFLSRYPVATYFMGTWKRVYDLYDYDMISYRSARKNEKYKHSFFSLKERLLSEMLYGSYVKSVEQGHRQNTYDVQMDFLVHRFDMFSVYPNVNLAKNIGLDYGANTDRRNIKEGQAILYSDLNIGSLDSSEIQYMPKVEYSQEDDIKFYDERILHHDIWLKVFSKALFLRYFGTFYNRWIKPIRRR